MSMELPRCSTKDVEEVFVLQDLRCPCTENGDVEYVYGLDGPRHIRMFPMCRLGGKRVALDLYFA